MKNIHQMRYLLIAAILLLFVSSAVSLAQDEPGAPNTGLRASLAPDPAKFGSLVVLTLAYHLPDGGHLPAKPEIGGLEDLTTVEQETGLGVITLNLLVDQLDSWRTGPLSLAYLDKKGEKQALTADPVSVAVLSNLGDKPEEAQLRPIQGIIPTKALWLRYLPWGACLLLLLLAGAGLFWWHKRGRFQTVTAELLDPAHVKARKEMEHLVGQGLFEQGKVKEFYFRFSEILRHYLEALRGFPAAEFTTEEIAIRIHTEQDRRLLPLLRHADLVKFADTVPSPARKKEEVETAFSYIQETSRLLESDTPGDRLQGVSR
jgi:hypothetical protein